MPVRLYHHACYYDVGYRANVKNRNILALAP